MNVRSQTKPCPMNAGTIVIVMVIATFISMLGSELIRPYGEFWSIYTWDIIACILVLGGIPFMLILRGKRYKYKHEAIFATIFTIPTIIAMTGLYLLASHYLKPSLARLLDHMI